jgi:MRG
MPEYIARTDMSAEDVAKVKEEMTLLMQWMARNHQRLFVNELERPTAEYIEASRD